MKQKLKPGEIIGRENNDGIVVAKWRDKRDVTVTNDMSSRPVTVTYRASQNVPYTSITRVLFNYVLCSHKAKLLVGF